MRFDEVADRVLGMIAEVAGGSVTVRRRGSFGVLTAEMATPLAMVLTELVQNAVEHGYDDGSRAARWRSGSPGADGDRLTVQVVDDGRGLPAGFEVAGSDRLGLADRADPGRLRARRSRSSCARRNRVATVVTVTFAVTTAVA